MPCIAGALSIAFIWSFRFDKSWISIFSEVKSAITEKSINTFIIQRRYELPIAISVNEIGAVDPEICD